MEPLQLHDTTGSRLADTAARSVIAIFETAFPGRVAGYFVEGSFAAGSAVAASDLDLIIVFKDRFAGAAERLAASQIDGACTSLSRLALDLEITDELALGQGAGPAFKLATRCLYGTDMRQAVPLLPIEDWARRRMHAAAWLIGKVYPRAPHPGGLGYPDPDDQFYGYARRPIALADGGEAPSTRDLVRVSGWAATALIAHRAGRYVARKSECAAIYRESINDEWGGFLQEMWDLCRGRWAYHVPAEPAEQALLRSICARNLGFERHVLAIYREFLLSELAAQDGAALAAALAALARNPTADPELLALLAGLGSHADPAIQAAAAQALAAATPRDVPSGP